MGFANDPEKTNKNINSKYLLGLSLIQEIGPVRFKKIIQSFDSIEKAWHSSKNEMIKIFGDKIGTKIWDKKSKIDLKKEIDIFRKEKVVIISPKYSFKDFSGINTSFFPQKLLEIPSPPFILFVKGDLKLISKNQLAIVGSRRPTHYGKQVIEKLGPEIALSGLIITSGLAMGVDSLAHRIALENEQPTIAVLGNGLGQKILRKSFNYKLSQEIIEKNGLLISEYPPNFEANKFTFPARNRIISGLALGVLIVEAAEKSGTLITARHALEQNREVLVVPGNIFSQQSVGTNNLIKQGAEPVTSTNNILKALNWKNSNSRYSETTQQIVFNDEEEKLIYNKLSFDPQPLDKLISKSDLDISSISIKLSIMELKGMIKNVNGGYIRN